MGRRGIDWAKIEARTDPVTARRLQDYADDLRCLAELVSLTEVMQSRCTKLTEFILRDVNASMTLGVCGAHLALVLRGQLDEGEHRLFSIERLAP